jgi:hypothetical protein
MFLQLRELNDIPSNVLFATRVGPAREMTSAMWHVPNPMDIVDTMALCLEGQIVRVPQIYETPRKARWLRRQAI